MLCCDTIFFQCSCNIQLFLQYPQIVAKQRPDVRKATIARHHLEYLDAILKKNDYVCGNWMTLADLSVLATITFLDVIDFPLSSFSNIDSWASRLKTELQYYKECNMGLSNLKHHHSSGTE